MKNTTCLFGMTLLLSAIAVNERVAAIGAPARDVQPEQHRAGYFFYADPTRLGRKDGQYTLPALGPASDLLTAAEGFRPLPPT